MFVVYCVGYDEAGENIQLPRTECQNVTCQIVHGIGFGSVNFHCKWYLVRISLNNTGLLYSGQKVDPRYVLPPEACSKIFISSSRLRSRTQKSDTGITCTDLDDA